MATAVRIGSGLGFHGDAWEQGADIVLTGRVADAALSLAPLVHEFGWALEDASRAALRRVSRARFGARAAGPPARGPRRGVGTARAAHPGESRRRRLRAPFPWMGLSGPAYTCGFHGRHNTGESMAAALLRMTIDVDEAELARCRAEPRVGGWPPSTGAGPVGRP